MPEQSKNDNSLGVASLVLGIVSIVLPYIGALIGIAAIICAYKQRQVYPESLSLAGLITGIIGLVLWVLVTMIVIIAVIASA